MRSKTKEVDVYHVHWIASVIQEYTWTNNSIIFFIKLFLLWLDLFLARLMGMKLVWTIHNKYAHQGYDRIRELFIRKAFYFIAKKVIVHSENALLELQNLYGKKLVQKAQVILHGNYLNVYPVPSITRQDFYEQYGLSSNHILLLYFGAIRPHKGLEDLANAMNAIRSTNVKLILAGNCGDDHYKRSIIGSFQNTDNLIHDIRFIPDQDLINYISVAHAVVIPFSDTLTSGSVILAMTMGKGLILPDRSRILGCVPNPGVKYFSSPKQLAFICDNLDVDVFERMGEVNSAKAKSLSWDYIGKKTFDLYRKIR